MLETGREQAAEETPAAAPSPAVAAPSLQPQAGPLTTARVIALQRAAGNAAVAALLDDRRPNGATAPAPVRVAARPSILTDLAAARTPVETEKRDETQPTADAPAADSPAAATPAPTNGASAVNGVYPPAADASGPVGSVATGLSAPAPAAPVADGVAGSAPASAGASGPAGSIADGLSASAPSAPVADGAESAGASAGASGPAPAAPVADSASVPASAAAIGDSASGAPPAAASGSPSAAPVANGASHAASSAAGAAAPANDAPGTAPDAPGADAAGPAHDAPGAAPGGSGAGAAAPANDAPGAAPGTASAGSPGPAGAAPANVAAPGASGRASVSPAAAAAAGSASPAVAPPAAGAGAAHPSSPAAAAPAAGVGAASAHGAAGAGAESAHGAAGGGGASGHGAAGGGGAAAKDPEGDPGFQKMKAHAHGAGKGAKAHAPASAGAAAAQAAAVPPGNDAASQAAAAQVEEMAQQQPGAFDRAGFVKAVKEAIEAQSPATLEDADKFKSSGKAAKVKDQVSGLVKGSKQDAEKDIKGATEAAPDTSKAQPKPVTPMPAEPAGAAPASVGAAGAMPPPRPAAETDMSAGPAEVDAKMAEAKLTEPQLEKANEPDFTAALGAREQARENSQQAPTAARQSEKDILGKAQSGAQAVEGAGLAGMQGAKVQAFAKALNAKQDAKGADEGKRAKVATDIQGIYDRSKTDVQKILTGLDAKVDAAFGQGEQQARKQFEDFVAARMKEFKDKRYSGFDGAALWVADQFTGPPNEVNTFFLQGRTAYLTAMDAVIGRVADIVGAELNAARARIAAGRAEVRKYVAELPTALNEIGRDAEGKLDAQFEQLGAEIDSKQGELVDSLAKKYVESRDAVDARINQMKEENKGLIDRAKDAVVGVAKTVLQLKDMLLGVLAKAADVIDTIIADPIGFLGKLVDGVKAGLGRFVGNIVSHLQTGLMDWLFGALGGAGITLPKTFDLSGILDLVLQVLGLTYRNIRARVAKIVGEPIVARMEQVVDVFKTLATEGVGGLWKWVKDQLSNLEDMVLGSIKSFIIEKVIKAGITWLISFLNPAAAFIKACKAIYDIVMFLVERGSQIMQFVNSILDSVGAIAKGAIGIVAEKVESSLAKALPLAISFLASLLGLGGISDKIRSVIEKVQAPVNKAVDWVVMGAVKGFKKMFGGAVGWAKGKYQAGKEWVKGKYEAGKAYVKGKVTALSDKVKQKFGGPGDSDASIAVKAKAAERLKPRLAQPFENEDQLKAAVAGVENELKPEGLKSLTLKAGAQKDESEEFTVIASASKGVPSGTGTVKKPWKYEKAWVIESGGKYTLRPNCQGQHRSLFYPKHYCADVKQRRDESVDNWTQRGLEEAKTKRPSSRHWWWKGNECPDGEWFDRTTPEGRPTIDHQPSVSQHWNERGNRTNYKERCDWYTGADGHIKVVVIPGSVNSERGSTAAASYRMDVFKAFTYE